MKFNIISGLKTSLLILFLGFVMVLVIYFIAWDTTIIPFDWEMVRVLSIIMITGFLFGGLVGELWD